MKFSISQIPGALPEKRSDTYAEDGDETMAGEVHGFNLCLDTIAAVEYELDVKRIQEATLGLQEVVFLTTKERRIIAQAIAAQGPALLRVVTTSNY